MKTFLKKALSLIIKAFLFVKNYEYLNVILLGVCFGLIWGFFGWLTVLFLLIVALLVCLIWFLIDVIKLVAEYSKTLQQTKELVLEPIDKHINVDKSHRMTDPALEDFNKINNLWPDVGIVNECINLYKYGKRIEAIKKLTDHAQGHTDEPLKWSKEFLNQNQ